MNVPEYIAAFNIGRGGRFYNQGYKKFLPYVTKLSDCFSESSIIICEDEYGNQLPDEEWELVDGGSNVILRGREAIESDTGILDWDGDYDTDIVKYLADCDDSEIEIIYDAYLDGEWLPDDVKDYLCTKKGVHRILCIDFFKANAEIHCHDCTIHFDWDGVDWTEEDAAEWMLGEDIDPISIEKHADRFESHFYNN